MPLKQLWVGGGGGGGAVSLSGAQFLHTVYLYLYIHPSHPVNVVYTFSRRLPHNILPDFKNSRGYD